MAKSSDNGTVKLAVTQETELPYVIHLKVDGEQKVITFMPISDFGVPKQWADAAVKNYPKLYMYPTKDTVVENYRFSDKWKNQTVVDVVSKLNSEHKAEIFEMAKAYLEEEQNPKPAEVGTKPVTENAGEKDEH